MKQYILYMNNIETIVNIIKSGGVVLIQTDTVFGLICDGLNNNAIKKIENIKRRNKPSFGFFVKNINVARQYANMTPLQEKCFNRVFPGYFTLILPASELAIKKLQERTLGEKNNIKTIGLRVPKNSFCIKILDYFEIPLVATSANISGQPIANVFEEIDKTIVDSVDAVYYDKSMQFEGKSSTIIDITNTEQCTVIREGSGDINELKLLISFRKNS